MTRTIRLNGAARAGLYLFAFGLVFWPLADLTTNAWPPQPGNVQWRYGFAGLLSAFLHTPIMGLLLAMAVAYGSDHVRTLKTLAWVQLVVAAALLLLMVMFALDLLQVRGLRPAGALPAMIAGGAIAEAKYVTAAGALLFTGIGALRMAASSKVPTRTASTPSDMVMQPRGEAR